jgi:hypothetical protein
MLVEAEREGVRFEREVDVIGALVLSESVCQVSFRSRQECEISKEYGGLGFNNRATGVPAGYL